MAYTQESDLPTAYEKKVKQADNISDRLRMDADQVVKRAQLEGKIESMASRIVICQLISKKQKTIKPILTSDGQTFGSPEYCSRLPREMKQWLLKAERLIEKIQTAKALSTHKEKLSDACNQLRESVSHQISQFAPWQKTEGKRLESLISLCEQRIEQEENAHDKRREIERSLKDSQIRFKRIQDELKTVENDLTAWSDEWEKAIEGLSLKPHIHPETAAEPSTT